MREAKTVGLCRKKKVYANEPTRTVRCIDGVYALPRKESVKKIASLPYVKENVRD